MDTTTIKRMIGQCDVVAELAEVRRAVKDREELLHKRAREKAAAEAWDRVKGLKHGDKLWCCCEGIFLGGDIQRGTSMVVYTVQPKKKRVWVMLEGSSKPTHWFGPEGVSRYNLRTQAPGEPVDKKLAASMKEVGKILTDAGM